MPKLSKADAALKIVEIVRDEKYVSFKYVTPDLAAQEHAVKYIECPTPTFDKTFQQLGGVAARILEYGDPDNVTVVSLTIRRTKSGTKSAIIGFYKALSAVDHPHLMESPQFRIDQPAENEQGIRQCAEPDSQLIYKMMELAKGYIAGERLQTLLPLVEEGEEDDGVEEDKGQKLPFKDEVAS